MHYKDQFNRKEVNAQEVEFSFTEEDEDVFPEGKEMYKIHKLKERNVNLIEKAKRKKYEKNPTMSCEVCGFSFVTRYGEIGLGFIEAHHIRPLSDLSSEIETRFEDIVFVCSNCHRMLHRKRPWLKIHELKNLLNNV